MLLGSIFSRLFGTAVGAGDVITLGLIVVAVWLGIMARRAPSGDAAGGPNQLPLNWSSVATALLRLPARAATLLEHLPSLGLPAVIPLVRDVAQGNWLAIPGDVHPLLDSLDNKSLRGGMLDTIFQAQLERQFDGGPREAALLKAVEERKVKPTTPPATN